MNYKEIAAFTKRRTVKPLPPSGFDGGQNPQHLQSQEDTMPHHYKKERNAMNETIHAEFF